VEFHKDLEGSVLLDAFWREFRGGRSRMKINDRRVASKEFVGEFLFDSVATMLSYLNQSRSKARLVPQRGINYEP
jgi:hypothetical protein